MAKDINMLKAIWETCLSRPLASASVCYSGGGIYIAWGKFYNDLFFMASITRGNQLEMASVLKGDPSALDDSGEMVGFSSDWIEENETSYPASEDDNRLASMIIDYLIVNGSDECENYQIDKELKELL